MYIFKIKDGWGNSLFDIIYQEQSQKKKWFLELFCPNLVMLPCLFEISKLSLKELHTIMIFRQLGILTRLVWIKFVKRYLSLLSRVKKFSSKLNKKNKHDIVIAILKKTKNHLQSKKRRKIPFSFYQIFFTDLSMLL